MMNSPAATQMHESATLKDGQWPYQGRMKSRKSTTKPCRMRSVRLPAMPASKSAAAICEGLSLKTPFFQRIATPISAQ